MNLLTLIYLAGTRNWQQTSQQRHAI